MYSLTTARACHAVIPVTVFIMKIPILWNDLSHYMQLARPSIFIVTLIFFFNINLYLSKKKKEVYNPHTRVYCSYKRNTTIHLHMFFVWFFSSLAQTSCRVV